MPLDRIQSPRGGYWGMTQFLGKAKSFTCGHCAQNVASNVGYGSSPHRDGSLNPDKWPEDAILICPQCHKPTYLGTNQEQVPGPMYGRTVTGISSPEVQALYDESRKAASNGAFTASVMICRKILMNLAVNKGAAPNLKFYEYANWLAANGYVPPEGKRWLEEIRDKGNEANHEIHLMSAHDADDILALTGILLVFIFELPSRATRNKGSIQFGQGIPVKS